VDDEWMMIKDQKIRTRTGSTRGERKSGAGEEGARRADDMIGFQDFRREIE
jgi:hypothetical protein